MDLGRRFGALFELLRTRSDASRAKQLAPAMRLVASAGMRAVAEALDTHARLTASMIWVDGNLYRAAATASLVAVAAASLHRISAERAMKALPGIQASIISLGDEQTTALFRGAIGFVERAQMHGSPDGADIIPAASDFLLQTLCTSSGEVVAPEQLGHALLDLSNALLWPINWWE